ncbi:hypothetical protein CONLIGDRAFT_651694 [Coniochaeta ligniaria NRRL 30616]|uniref:Uncharacterized protein n=1 Tax=Coniochaeta ligniaria NRRL 30616 TaxID=1408157 RepID=A0A1J7IZD5_9PEZI|nr:hypothetical protein CONLIGDRAFT_651694 [Coniochaeta ligniaria NRRL 30616]
MLLMPHKSLQGRLGCQPNQYYPYTSFSFSFPTVGMRDSSLSLSHQYSGLASILVDSAAPWATNGEDISGDNLLIIYDPKRRQILWNVNLTATSQGRYGAFQDVEHDNRGNTYAVGTYPGTIMRVKPEGTKIYKFDMRKERGIPVLVPMARSVTYEGTDAIYSPPKYDGTVLLVAINFSGVQRCEYLGTIPNPDTPVTSGSATTGVVQMRSNSIYMIDDRIPLPFVPGQAAGNRTVFLMIDITEDVERLLRK